MDQMPAFVPPSFFPALGRSDTVTYVSLVDLFMFLLNSLDFEEALLCEEVPHIWNPIIKKGSEVEDQRL